MENNIKELENISNNTIINFKKYSLLVRFVNYVMPGFFITLPLLIIYIYVESIGYIFVYLLSIILLLFTFLIECKYYTYKIIINNNIIEIEYYKWSTLHNIIKNLDNLDIKLITYSIFMQGGLNYKIVFYHNKIKFLEIKNDYYFLKNNWSVERIKETYKILIEYQEKIRKNK